jgi:hypothetical protein
MSKSTHPGPGNHFVHGTHDLHLHLIANGGVHKGGGLHIPLQHHGAGAQNFEGLGTDGPDSQSGGKGADGFCFGPGDSGIGAGNRDIITDFNAHDLMGFIEFAGPGKTLTTNVLKEKGFDVVQLFVNGELATEVQTNPYHWHDYNFLLSP